VNSSSAFNCLVAGLYAMGNGDPMSDAAWEWAQAFVDNLDGVSLNSSSQVYKGVAEGEYVVGLTWEDPAAAYVRDGVAVKVVFPEEGTFLSGQCVSIIKGAPHMENAKKFVDYMLSEACQSYVGQNTTVRPLRANVTLDSSLASWDSITKLSTYDGVWVAENKSSITEHYTQCLENAG
jgi:iron(III) transport system substrate-binding protein